MNGYGLLAQDIILVLLKDYRKADEAERAELRTWQDEEKGCVQFCATALGISVEQLSTGLRRQIEEIDALLVSADRAFGARRRSGRIAGFSGSVW